MNINEIKNNPETPESIKPALNDVSVYITLLESQRAQLVEAILEVNVTGILSQDIVNRIGTGEFGVNN